MGCFVIIVNGWTSLKICPAGYNNNQKEQSAIYEKILTCEHYNYVVDLFNVHNNSFNWDKFNIYQIRNNTTLTSYW